MNGHYSGKKCAVAERAKKECRENEREKRDKLRLEGHLTEAKASNSNLILKNVFLYAPRHPNLGANRREESTEE